MGKGERERRARRREREEGGTRERNLLREGVGCLKTTLTYFRSYMNRTKEHNSKKSI